MDIDINDVLGDKSSDENAIVIYETKERRESVFTKAYDTYKQSYLAFLILSVFAMFLGYCISMLYGGNAVSPLFGESFSSVKELIISQSTRNAAFLTLIMYISAYTVFSPVVSVLSCVYICANAGTALSIAHGFVRIPAVAVIVFITLFYCSAVYNAFGNARYGVMRVFRPENVIAISAKTVLFLLLFLTSSMILGTSFTT